MAESDKADKLKILVVDDSLFIRTFLNKILSMDPEIGEIRSANDGLGALALLSTFRPNIITLDIEMPRMNGIDTLKAIKQKYNIPVLMVSSLTRKGADITIKALEMGAVDWIQKPDNSFDSKVYESLAHELMQKIKLLANRDTSPGSLDRPVVRAPASAYQPPAVDRDNMTVDMFKRLAADSRWMPRGSANLPFYLVAIGVSTGGPSALNLVIPKLHRDMNAAVIIVQHMPATFTKVLAERLDSLSSVTVKEAEDNELIQKGMVYIVPGEKHIRILDGDGDKMRIKLDHYPKIGGFRPSAEALFYFVGEAAREKSIGIVMTGMGSDGSENLGIIQNYSHRTIAQDEASCVIFGMPKMAIQKGHVEYVLPLNNIVDKINEFIIR